MNEQEIRAFALAINVKSAFVDSGGTAYSKSDKYRKRKEIPDSRINLWLTSRGKNFLKTVNLIFPGKKLINRKFDHNMKPQFVIFKIKVTGIRKRTVHIFKRSFNILDFPR